MWTDSYIWLFVSFTDVSVPNEEFSTEEDPVDIGIFSMMNFCIVLLPLYYMH